MDRLSNAKALTHSDTQWATVPSDEQQRHVNGLVHILLSHCLTLYN